MAEQQIKAIEGAGGKGGGGGRSATEAPNTLSSRAIVKVVEVISEGEIEGIAGGAQGIYINDTPLGNVDDSYNFDRATWDYRVGLPSQEYMTGFPAVENEISVGTTLVVASPVTRTTSAPNIDAVRVTIGLPQGLYEQDTSTGDINGALVTFAIDHKLTSSGTWVQVGEYTIEGKTNSSTEKQYPIQRPSGSGTWDIRVRRITADSTLSSLRNATSLSRVTEVQDIQLPYNDTAYVGISIDAESVSNQIPKRSYLVKGIKVKVPSNYNPTTRAYTGIWNGTFTTAWTDNPAWVLYDLITNVRYGLGEFVPESAVDKFSFYDAAVYNDGLVPDGDGGTEPRFTFNAVIASREEAYRQLSAVAGAMRGSLIYVGGQVKLIQDRPADPVKLVTKANVIEGKFDYRSTGLFERHTAFNVTFNDRADRHLQRVVTVDSSNVSDIASTYSSMLSTAETRYGYNPIDISAFGATKESQAIRQALWALDTELTQTEIVQFKMGMNGFDLLPGDIIKLWDEDYVAARGGGRIVSVSGTTVVLDRAITLSPGSKIEVLLADGVTIEQRNVDQTSGDLSTITVDSAFSQSVLEGADYVMTIAASARQFRILAITQDEAAAVAVEAVYHDPNKYSRVEDNINTPAQVFTLARRSITSAPVSLNFTEVSVNNADEGLNGVRRALLVSWLPPANGSAVSYVFKHRLNSGEWTINKPKATSFEISPAFSGTYDVEVAAVGTAGIPSTALTGYYTISVGGGSASTLNAPTSLQVSGGGTSFTGSDINFQWTNPSSNADVLTATLRDFEVRFIETSGPSTVRTVYVPAVPAGSVQTSTYSYSMNLADGGPRRSVKIEVRCRDTKNNLSDPVSVTFTNPAPASITGVSTASGIGNIKITFDRPSDLDFAGVLLWRSTTTGFTPSAGNYLYDTRDNYISDQVDFGTTYYYKIAAYDTFSRPLDGAGLNIPGQFSASSLAGEGFLEVATLPDPSGYTGPKIVYLESDGQLYSYVDGAWEPTIPPVSDVLDGSVTVAKFASGLRPVEIVGTLPTTSLTEGRMVFLTSDDKLYRYTGSAWTSAVPAADITGTLTNSQIADLAAAKLTGQVVQAQIADAAINTAKFASGIEPVTNVTSVPGTLSTRTVFNTTDGKLYRWNGTAYVATVPTTDLSGSVTNSQIADLDASKLTGTLNIARIASGALDATKFASSIKPVEVVGALPGTPHVEGRMVYLTTDDKLYRNTGSGWIASVPSTDITGTLTNSQIADIAATKITGQLVSSQIADASISTAKFASSIKPVEVLGSLPGTPHVEGRMVYLTTDNKLYRNDGAGWIASVPATDITGQLTDSQLANIAAAKLTGQITTTQITDDSITTAKVAAGAITASEIAANTITAAKIASGTITSTQIAADTITAGNIAANAITSSELAANSVIAGKVAAGAITADEIAANSITVDKLLVSNFSNLIENPDFELGAVGWTNLSYIINDPANAFNGSWVMKRVQASGAASVISLSNTVKAVEGEAYRIAGSMKSEAGVSGSAYWRLRWYNAAGAVLRQDSLTWTGDNLTWTTKSATFIAPTDTAYFIVAPYTVGTGTFYWDGVSVTRAADSELIVDGAITTDKLTANAVTAVKIAAGTITGDRLAANTITATQLAANTITATEIAANAITSSELAANSVIAGKVAAGAITADEIAAGSISATKLVLGDTSNVYPDYEMADAAFYTGGPYVKVVTGATTTGQNRFRIEANVSEVTVNSLWFQCEPNTEYYAEANVYRETGTTGSADILINMGSLASTGVVTWVANAVVANNITTSSSLRYGASFTTGSTTRRMMVVLRRDAGGDGDFSFGGVVIRRMAAGSLIVDGAITADKIAANTITANEIAANAITSSELAANSVIAGKVQAGAISTTELAADAITTDKIAAGAVTATELASNSVTAVKILAGTITGDKLVANTITATQIAANTLTANEIAANAITSSELAANSVIAGKVAAGAITADEIAAGAITANKLAITNRDSVFPDPGWYDSGWWANGSPPAGVTGGGGSTGWPVDRALRFTGSTGTFDFSTKSFPVETGGSYRYRVTVYVTADFNGQFSVVAHWPNQSWFQLGLPTSGTVTGSSMAALNVPTRGVWHQYESTFNNAAGLVGGIYANYSQFRFSGSGATAGTVYVAIDMVRAYKGELLVDGAITADKVAANAITAGKIAASSIDASKIVAGTITGDRLVANTLTSDKIAAGTITGDRMVAGTVTATQIASDAVTAVKIQANAVTADKINVTNLAAVKANTGALTVDNALTVSTSGKIVSGKTTYGAGTGFILEFNGGTPRFDIGSTAQYLRWTGSALDIKLDKVTLTGTTPGALSFPKNDGITRVLGSTTITATGGTAPYTYSWTYNWSIDATAPDIDNLGSASFSSNVATMYGRGDTDCSIGVTVTCTVTDSNGLSATISKSAVGTFGTGPS